MPKEKFDAIVVGAGPAGTSAAYTMAKAGLSVLLLERGEYPGSKNVMGGVLYRQMMEDVIPGFWKEAPLERHIVEQRFWLLGPDSVTSVGHKNERFAQEPYNNFTVFRAKFDRWFAGKAQEAGALLVCETTADDLIIEDGRVAGVRVERANGELYADVVVIADGVNSLLAKKAGLHVEIRPEHAALTVKEILALPKEKIQDRFNLEGNQGATIELAGDNTAGMVGMGFIYTNQETISIGVGALVSELTRKGIKPYDLLDRMKSHPAVRSLIAGAEVKEYLAHLIPEGGRRAMPRIYGNGFLIAGDSAMLVNALFREGSNMAMTSGRLAGETVIRAKERGDFSARALAGYERALNDTFVLKDLGKLAGLPGFTESHPELFGAYPELVNEAAYQLALVDGASKGEKQKRIIDLIRAKTTWWNLARTLWSGWKAVNSGR